MRTSADRWEHLAAMLTSLERIFEANARLDAYRPSGRGRPRNVDGGFGMDGRIATRLDVLERRILREANTLTVERLALDLDRKKEQQQKQKRIAA